ncbi:hypothetical protein NBT05_10950 [Aquimarina sp. ERC-38]|nr:hypothetical protein [Aquimarina sp. ERC-38]UZO79477.1 hypothetical protein NBT05_10950 [Aquimarina sp. ERC-38]
MSSIPNRDEMTQKTRANYHGKEDKYNARQINKEDIQDLKEVEDENKS